VIKFNSFKVSQSLEAAASVTVRTVETLVRLLRDITLVSSKLGN
jgi:hypothetical protein